MVSESYPESCPNDTRIIPQTSQFWTSVHLQDQSLCFVSINLFSAAIRHGLHYASCCFWENPTTAPCSGILQWQQHANSKAHTHTTLTAAPWSSTLQRHYQPVPERTRHANSCTLQRAAAPFTSTLAAWAGYSTYPPCSTLKHHPCSSTSRLARQHPQAAPSTGIRSPACPLQSMV